MGVKNKPNSLSAEEAQSRLEHQCSMREMCISQVRQKLYRWGVSPDDSNKIIQYLLANRYVDDNRFAKAFARDKFRFDKWGPSKIRMHLKAKGIDAAIINDAISLVEDDALPDAVIREIKRKYKTIKAKNTYERKMKVTAFGVRKGFDYELVKSCVDAVSVELNSSE